MTEWVIVILFPIAWLTCIIWVAIDASKRNISPWFWSLATLLSGPLGLVTYGVVREFSKQKSAD